MQVHREFLGVERRPEGVGAVRLPVRAGVRADVPVLGRALAEMLPVLAEVRVDVSVDDVTLVIDRMRSCETGIETARAWFVISR